MYFFYPNHKLQVQASHVYYTATEQYTLSGLFLSPFSLSFLFFLFLSFGTNRGGVGEFLCNPGSVLNVFYCIASAD